MFGLFKGAKNLMALKNAINAKLLYKKCTKEEKQLIKQSAIALYRSGGRSHLYSSIKPEHQRYANEEIERYEKNQDFHFYSMISYAFQSLGHEPGLHGEEWQIINNPFTLQVKENDVCIAKDWFHDKHGLSVQMKL